MKVVFVSVCALACTANAFAQEASEAVVISGEVGVVSDYRWRGVSLTDNEPALQAGVYASHASGLYVGVWSAAPTRESSDIEVDLSVGYAFPLWDGDLDLSVVGYIYPDLDDTDYATFSSVYERPIGEWTARALFEYAPIQQNLADESVYAALETERPIGDTGLSLMAGVGWEKGAFTLDGEKWDYSLGARYRFGSAALDLTYVDTDETAPVGEEDVYGGGVTLALKTEF
jgi:uncharacterized protein (TIGR02001 family)